MERGKVSSKTMATIASTRLEKPPPPEQSVVGNYFVAAYPPFSCWAPPQVPAVGEALRQAAPDEPLGLYVHIPFCQKKCDYCYYLSYVGANYEAVNRYLERIVQELGMYAQCPGVNGRSLAFIYFGGGTPSTLTSYQIRSLAAGLQSHLSWGGIREVTFECAPRSVRLELLETLSDIGVTRLSMGVQSFDNTLLRLNGRIHLADDVARAYCLIQQSGFDWVNLDLMVGLMGETPEKWQESIRRVIELSPDSVTIYQTEIPFNTALYHHLKAGCLAAAPASWEVKRQRLDYAFHELEHAGYTVVSGYAAVKDPVRRRFQYQEHVWKGGDMLGLGVASFSYFQGIHFQNQVMLDQYEEHVHRGSLPLQRAFCLGDWDQLVRKFILQLKWGAVSAEPFQKEFGVDITRVFARALQSLVEEGFATYDERGVRLTREGLVRVDSLLPRFYDPEFQDIRYT